MKFLIINEQHTLMPQQEQLLKDTFGTWDTIKVPADGWTKKQIELIAYTHFEDDDEIILASPIPYLIKELMLRCVDVHILHNDTREKKELPGGKIIYTVAKEGWVLV